MENNTFAPCVHIIVYLLSDLKHIIVFAAARAPDNYVLNKTSSGEVS